MNSILNELYKHWISSGEESTDEIAIFRPKGTKIPFVRGAKEIEIKQNGDFILYELGPGDEPITINGKWKMEEENKLIINLEGESKQRIWYLSSVDKDYLKIKKPIEL